VRIDRAMLHDTVAEMIDGPLIEPVLFEREPTTVDRSTAALVRYLSFICADLDEGVEGMARTFASVNAAKLFLELLVQSVRNNYSDRLAGRAEPLLPVHVKRAVAFIAANALADIDLDQIVASAGVRPRTLYEGFSKYCGTSPIAYLRAVRLDIAREKLREPAEHGSSVTEVALACGFEHLGKFAQLYRARFGELPSETLKRHN
jgi:transcriptional regulator GlxA family with amidase domain